MNFLRWLLLPFSLIYGLVIMIRNWFYDAGFLKSTSFTIPVISIGNLEVGGAGKTPMVEYLARLLMLNYKIATLSRGYGRKTKGYLLAQLSQEITNQPTTDNVQPTTHNLQLTTQIGDEPAQFKQKFPDVSVAVCEKRVVGVRKLMANHDLIILDDAYQHRAVNPGLSILLFDYSKVRQPHIMLPAGNYREPFSGRWRAQIIIVTKCPTNMNQDAMGALAQVVKPLPFQSLFFTSIVYKSLFNFNGEKADFVIDNDTTVFLLTGIANSLPLVNHLNTLTDKIIHHKYPDHYPFTIKNIAKLASEFSLWKQQKKVIITTEKDAQRLNEAWFKKEFNKVVDINIHVLPIEVAFLNNGKQDFDQLIFEYVRTRPAINSIH
jgi:tetraacyldisaccharide 4'-kinase